MSHPTWVRGLKLSANFYPSFYHRRVAPYVGAWIETLPELAFAVNAQVAPYVGAWIETIEDNIDGTIVTSHPTWVRGLKHV